ncbi:MAG TPA: universal stress protein [Candidatus Angelobacter sp.]
MTNKVLVAIDSTGLSPLVVDSLCAQTRPGETEVLLLQVVEPFSYSVPPEMAAGYAPDMAARQQVDLDAANENLNRAAASLSKAGFKVESRVVESEIKQGILTVASEWGAHLIVVTSHARKGIAKFLHRSVAEGIVHRASCSVLVVKEAAAQAAA